MLLFCVFSNSKAEASSLGQPVQPSWDSKTTCDNPLPEKEERKFKWSTEVENAAMYCFHNGSFKSEFAMPVNHPNIFVYLLLPAERYNMQRLVYYKN